MLHKIWATILGTLLLSTIGIFIFVIGTALVSVIIALLYPFSVMQIIGLALGCVVLVYSGYKIGSKLF